MKKFSKKILLVFNSEVTPPSETKLFNSFKKICPDTTLLFVYGNEPPIFSTMERILNKVKLPVDKFNINERIKTWANTHKPDLVFIVKGLNIHPSTLSFLKKLGCQLVFWSNDDMYAWHGRSLYFTLGLPLYDLVVTQKSYNCSPNELPALGAKRILFQDKAYDPALHFPCEELGPASLSHEVLFIGAYEMDRFEKLKYLAEKGIAVNIYGWGKQNSDPPSNLIFHNKHLYGKEFRCAITHAKVCLNFLRKKNRDLQTSRSIEIPSCRGFMLAERSNEHLRLFKEDSEAVFFSSKEELLEKIQFYLGNDELRNKISQSGYERCLHDGYSFDNRVMQVLETVF